MRVLRRNFFNLSSSTILLGRSGENEVTQLDVDISRELSEYPNSTFELLFTRPNESDPYPVLTTVEGRVLSYVIGSYDLGIVGYGQLELVMYGSNGEVKKSAVAKTRIEGTLLNGNQYPSSVQKWFDLLRQKQVEIEALLKNLGGSDGFSPVVTVSEISGGHRITIVDAEHTSGQTFDVFDGTNGRDGADGHDGVSPSVTVEEITGGHRVIITDEDHPNGQSFDVLDGEAAQEQHSHSNLSELNKITEKSGMIAYNGKIVGVQFTNSIPPYNADLEYGRIIYFTGQTEFSLFHNGLLFYDKPNGWIQLTEESFSTWYRNHADTLAKITAPNGIPHYNGKSIYAYIREVLSSFVAQDGDLFIDTSIGHTAVDGNGDLLIDVDIAAQMTDNEMEVFICS